MSMYMMKIYIPFKFKYKDKCVNQVVCKLPKQKILYILPQKSTNFSFNLYWPNVKLNNNLKNIYYILIT